MDSYQALRVAWDHGLSAEMQRSLKRKLIVVVAALAVIAFAGGAYAATQSSTANVRQAFLNDVARRLNVTPSQLRSALTGAFDDQLNNAVAQGHLTRAQAAAIRQRAQRTGVVPLGALLGPGHGLPPRGFGPAPRGFGPPAFGPRAFLLPMLGIRPFTIAKGKSAAALKAALLARARQTIDRLVAAKLISARRAKRLLARLPARIDRLINRTRFRFPLARLPFPLAPRPIP